MNSLGLRASTEDALLIKRAREALAGGPLDAVVLMERICALPGAPRAVAERLAEALFTRHAEFARDAGGCWALVRRGAASPVVAEGPSQPVPPRWPADPGVPARRRSAAPRDGSDVALRDLRFAVVDVETTGSSPNHSDRVTEIAVVTVDRGEVTEVFETLVNPERGIPPAIVALTQITWEMVKDAPRFAEVSEAVLERLRARVFVAHNASFDWRFVSSEVHRASGVHLAGERLCTVRMARTLLPQLPRRNLDSVTRYFGVEIAARHRAAGDALATAQVLTRLIRLAEDQGASTWGELTALLAAPSGAKRRRRSPWPRGVSVDPTL